jgi:hypothetical protein
MTAAVLKTDYDLRPTDGLCIGDVINVGGVDITLTGVNADGKTLAFAATTVTAAIGDPVFLKAQTASFPALQEPFYFGNALVGVAATSALADTAAASRTTATPCYDVGVEIDNNLLSSPASGYTGPAALLNQIRSGILDLARLFTDPTQYQKWIENVKQAVTIIATGRFIKTDFSTSELLTIKMNKTKLMTNEQPLEVGQYIFDRQKLELLYDSGDAAAITITLVNRTAGTSY